MDFLDGLHGRIDQMASKERDALRKEVTRLRGRVEDLEVAGRRAARERAQAEPSRLPPPAPLYPDWYLGEE
jgi:hypothetical protein